MVRKTPGYRLFTKNEDDHYVSVTVRPFDNDESAVAYARSLLAAAPSVEIWRGEDFVERIGLASAGAA